jgi:hypothetical protein
MQTWKTSEWKEKASLFIKDKVCSWCSSTENLVPHHPRKKGGYTHEEYMDIEKYCIPLCQKCNFMESKGYRLCPQCKTHYYKPKRGRDKLCWNCFIQTDFGKKVAEYCKLKQKT